MPNKEISASFEVFLEDGLEPITPTISKGRVRIFYKYKNRNRTYITDEFAEKLIKTLPYSPIVGIYDKEKEDFLAHSEDKGAAQVYGVVPENPNAEYVSHLDEDGVTRDYLTCDAYLFTARFKEASEIVGKGQSMELYKPSIKGEWKEIDHQEFYVFEDGSFLGLSVLGNDVEPCFEGSAFFALYKDLKQVMDELEKINFQKGGTKTMINKINFNLSHDEIYMKIHSAINPNLNEEGGWKYDYYIISVYDNYFVAGSMDEDKKYRFTYTKSDTDLTIGEKEEVFIIDVTADELTSLNAIKAINENSFNKIDELFASKDETITSLNETIAQKETAISEFNEKISTLETEKSEILAEKVKLEEYKNNMLLEEKEAVITKYSALLTPEALEEVKGNMEDMSVSDLEKELSYKLVQNTPNLFSLDQKVLIPQVNTTDTVDEIEELIKKYN